MRKVAGGLPRILDQWLLFSLPAVSITDITLNMLQEKYTINRD